MFARTMLVASWVLGACTANPQVTTSAPPTPVVVAPPVVAAPVVEPEPEPEPEPRRPCPKPVAAGPVELTIVDLLGRPIAGAEVTSSHEVDETPVRERLVADAQGRLTVPPQSHLTIAAPGFVALTNTSAGTLDPPRIHMLPASTLSGRARDASGAPLAGAQVLAVEHLGARDIAGQAKSDAAGRFRITGLAPGRYYLVTEDSRHRGVHGVAVGLGESVDDLELLAHRLVRVEGRVQVKNGGTCTSGHVTLNVGDLAGHGCTCSGEPDTVTAGIDPKTGVARFLLAPGQTYGVEAHCDDHLGGTEKPITVGRADIRGLKWTVRRGLMLRGRVLDEAGLPLAGAMITARDEYDERSFAETGANGQFTIAGLAPGSRTVMVDGWRKGGFLIGEQEVELDEQDITDLEIATEFHERDEDEDDEGPAGDCEVPAPWPELRGLVLDAGGAPVANAAVVRYQGSRPSDALAAISSWYGESPVLTDERGAFRIPIDPKEQRCKGGDCEDSLVAYRIGGGEGRSPTPPLDQTAEIRVGARATIVGTLKTAKGAPVTSFGTTLDQGTMYPPIDYQYDPSGAFALPGVLPDSFLFGAHTPAGDGGQRITVEAGQKLRVDLVVTPAREE